MNAADALIEKTDAFLKEIASTQSPITDRNHLKSLADWAGYLRVVKPLVAIEQHWDRNIVEENWKGFLFTMVSYRSLVHPAVFHYGLTMAPRSTPTSPTKQAHSFGGLGCSYILLSPTRAILCQGPDAECLC
jgi:hypothetical protein